METNRLTQACQTKKPTEQTEAKTKQGKGKSQTANEERKPEANQKTVRTTEADEGKPKPETYTSDRLTLR